MSELDRYKAKALTITGKPTWKIGYYHPAAYLHADLVEARHCIYTFPEGLIFDVNPDTLCQCTGLKDSQGRLCFYGDEITVKGDLQEFKFVLVSCRLGVGIIQTSDLGGRFESISKSPIDEDWWGEFKPALTGKNIHDKQTEQ